jgi:hypothetical protein
MYSTLISAIPESIHIAVIAGLVLCVVGLILLVRWFLVKWMKGIEDSRKKDNDAFTQVTREINAAIIELTLTLKDQSTSLKIFQEGTMGELNSIRITALSADRQGKLNEGEIIDIKQKLVEIKTEHDIFKEEHHSHFPRNHRG